MRPEPNTESVRRHAVGRGPCGPRPTVVVSGVVLLLLVVLLLVVVVLLLVVVLRVLAVSHAAADLVAGEVGHDRGDLELAHGGRDDRPAGLALQVGEQAALSTTQPWLVQVAGLPLSCVWPFGPERMNSTPRSSTGRPTLSVTVTDSPIGVPARTFLPGWNVAL